MITLTTPSSVQSVLGGSTPVAYNKLVIGPFQMDPVGQTVLATMRLTSTTAPTMQPITGTLRIDVPASELIVEVERLDFYRRIVLSGAQNTAILAQIEAAQSQLENGIISLGAVAGSRSAGA